MSTVQSTALDEVIVGWKDIYLQNKKVEKLNILTIKMLYKLKLYKMKVDIKWNQK